MSIAGFIRNVKLILELRHNPPFKNPTQESRMKDGNELIREMVGNAQKAQQANPIPAAPHSSEDRLTGLEKEISSLRQLLEVHGIR